MPFKRFRFIFILFAIGIFSLLVLFYLYQSLRLDSPRANAEAEAFFLIKVVFWGGGGLIVASFIRFLLSRAAEDRKPEKKDTGLLVDTYQDVIHELKQKERALTEINEGTKAYALTIENYNEHILKSVTSGVVTFNCDRKITTLNPAAEEILGISSSVVMGQICEGVFDANSVFSSLLHETLIEHNKLSRKESDVLRPDGEKISLGLTASPLRDQKGSVIGAIIVFTDLTEMKVLQEQLEMKKRLALMGEMSAFIAHEFRNYMGTILGFTSMLSKEFTPKDPGFSMTSAIIRELSTMEQLITDLLSYGKNPFLTLTHTDVILMIQEVMDSFQSAGHVAPKETHQTIRFISQFQPCEASIDPILMRQALSNLIRNALEAMALDGETYPGKLTATAGYLGDRFVEIKISNTGRGIPKDQLEKIFLPFFTTKEKGSGLGLALVQKIVLAHNGILSVENEEDVGTTFIMTIPRTP
ncbi:MAG: ATP-binding protein [Nitrospirota bacterium]